MADEDFDEEDVWAVVDEKQDIKMKLGASSPPSSSSRRRLTGSKTISKSNTEQGSRASQHESAPVNVPDWSKIYKQKSPSLDDDEEEDDDGAKVPPHEWIANKLARSQISSSSVCEGAGRTLKGRDLSKVRNAVLSKTGFIE